MSLRKHDVTLSRGTWPACRCAIGRRLIASSGHCRAVPSTRVILVRNNRLEKYFRARVFALSIALLKQDIKYTAFRLGKTGLVIVIRALNVKMLLLCSLKSILWWDKVLSCLLAVYVDDMVTRFHADQRSFTVLYADDILIFAPSLCERQAIQLVLVSWNSCRLTWLSMWRNLAQCILDHATMLDVLILI